MSDASTKLSTSEPSAKALHRWHLQVALATCGLGAWYGKLTGDQGTALQFDRLVQRMLRGLRQGSVERLKQDPLQTGGAALAPASSPEATPGYEQLALWP